MIELSCQQMTLPYLFCIPGGNNWIIVVLDKILAGIRQYWRDDVPRTGAGSGGGARRGPSSLSQSREVKLKKLKKFNIILFLFYV